MRIKSYLSYSQYSTFLASKKSYINTYILGNKFDNKYLRFGKMIADVLENRDKKNKNDNEEWAIELLETPEHSELELLEEFNKIPLFGKLDGYNESTKTIKEYKTGKIPWTQAKADKHEQLTFYAIMISKRYKIKIEDIKIELDWLETIEDVDGEMLLTGLKKTFKTKRTNKDLIRIYPKIKRVWKGIEELVDEYLK